MEKQILRTFGWGAGKTAIMQLALASMSKPGLILVVGRDGERVIDFQGEAEVIETVVLKPCPKLYYEETKPANIQPSKFLPGNPKPWKRR